MTQSRYLHRMRIPTMPTFQLLSSPAPLSGWLSRRLSGSLYKSDSLISNKWLPLRYQQQVAPPTVSWPVLLTLLLHDRLLSLSGTTFWCTQMADLPDILVFATLPSTQRCADGPLQAGRIYVRQHPHDAQLFFFDCISMFFNHKHWDATCI